MTSAGIALSAALVATGIYTNDLLLMLIGVLIFAGAQRLAAYEWRD